MTHGVLGISATALGLAALSCFCAPQARAVSAGCSGPSLERTGADARLGRGGSDGGGRRDGDPATGLTSPAATRLRATPRRESAHRTTHVGRNPLADAATGVVGGVADLGSVAAYPFYCFPNYGSCSVRVPYRY